MSLPHLNINRTSTNTNSFCSSLFHINMGIQPNFERMSEAVVIASQEIARVPNVPSFDNGQRIFEAIGALTRTIDTLRSEVGEVRIDMNNLRTDVNNLRTDVNNLRTDVTHLRTDVNNRFGLLELRMNAELDHFLLCSKLYYTDIVLIVRST